MKKLVFLTVLALGQSSFASIHPERSVYSFLDIFHNKNKPVDEHAVKVMATGYDRAGDLQPGSKHPVIVPAKRFEEYKNLASAVFEVHRDGGDVLWNGTAFHIGEGLLLTNHHVLNRDFKNSTKCDGFKIKTHSGAFVNCKKVHFCHSRQDICLIELAATRELPAVKISPLQEVNSESALITVIGNSQGYGIHVSEARGIQQTGGGYRFFAAARNGNSGGPIFNSKGEVVGIIRTESQLVKVDGSDLSEVNLTVLENALEAEPLLHDKLMEGKKKRLVAIMRRGEKKPHYYTYYINQVRALFAEDAEALKKLNEILLKLGATAYNNAATSPVVISLLRDALKNDEETLEKFEKAVLPLPEPAKTEPTKPEEPKPEDPKAEEPVNPEETQGPEKMAEQPEDDEDEDDEEMDETLEEVQSDVIE